MKIRLDDTWHGIEFWDEDIWTDLYRGDYLDFDKILRKVLTPTQYDIFIMNDTRRTFTISKKKADILNDLVKNTNKL